MSGAFQIAVLIVDDEVLIRMLLVDELEEAGITTFEAGDAETAIAIMNAHPEISVLFTDINMPGEMNGIDLASVVRRDRPDVHLLISSGRAQPSTELWPSGAVFVEKPYNIGKVANMIRHAA